MCIIKSLPSIHIPNLINLAYLVSELSQDSDFFLYLQLFCDNHNFSVRAKFQLDMAVNGMPSQNPPSPFCQ